MKWEEIRKSLGGLAQFIADQAVINSYVAVINSWARMSDEGAFENISAWVNSSSEQAVDQMDGVLLMMASGEAMEDARRRLIKFYAVFKIAELIRFQRLRGFPS